MKLYRSEAIENRQGKYLGTMLISTPLPLRVLTACVVACAALIVAGAVLLGYQRKETVQGLLVPETGVIRIYPTQTSVVVERHVSNDQAVNPGDILFVLSSESSTGLGNTQAMVNKSLEARIRRLKEDARSQQIQSAQQSAALLLRLEQLRMQETQLDSETALNAKRVDIAASSLKLHEELRDSRFLSNLKVQEKASEKLDQEVRLSQAKRAQATLQIELSAARRELADLPLRSGREASGIERDIAELEQQLAVSEARRQTVIRAPQAGLVTAITGEPGQAVSATNALATIIPQGAKLVAELYAPTRAIGFLQAGMPVQLRYDAFPYQQFGLHLGVIHEVSNTALAPADIPVQLARGANSTDPLYRIRVTLDRQDVQANGNAVKLKSGMQLEASIGIESRKLYEWALAPLYSVSGKL